MAATYLSKTRHATIFATLPVCCWLTACAVVDSSAESIDARVLLGAWKVDLRPTVASEPYYKEFVVTSTQGETFAGTLQTA